MKKKNQYLNQRINQETVRRLRKYEKANKLRPSISATIEHLLNNQKSNETLPRTS